MEKVSLSQIGLYNPRRQNSELSERLFVIRQKQFQMLMEELNGEKDNSIPQHHIIIAQRGMGKTTLLNRIAIELHKPVYNDRFIPLAFPEEQYNITNLGDFWLNCLDALADSLESEQYDEKEIARIDEQVKELSMHKGSEKTAAEAYGVFMEFCRKIKRRPVLLIDNIGILFNKLGKNNQHSLRALLSEAGAPIVMGAGVNVIPSQTNNKADALKPLTDYEMPFYDYFQIHYLKQLSFDEFLDLISKLSDITQTSISVIYKERSRLQSLHYLTGGNPRTAIMLFKLIAKGFAVEINDDLEALLDEITPLYKARYEELSEQAQKIIVEVALNDNMDAISLKQLSQKTGYANNQLSPQLKRLIEEGWLETTPAEKNKGNAYRMRERFFNIWLLMRESTRRKKQEITLLAKFMEWFYDDRLQEVAEKHSCLDFSTLNDGHYAIALIENCKLVNEKTRERLEDKLETLVDKIDLSNDYIGAIRDLNITIKLDANFSIAYNDIGYLYLYNNKPPQYKLAEEYFLKAISCNKIDWFPKLNLVMLYRDKLNQFAEARELFNEIKDQLKTEDGRFLQEVLFELHDRNEGIAKEYLLQALQAIEKALPKSAGSGWYYFAAICIDLKYGEWLLKILSDGGFDKILAPFYVAIQAMEIERQENAEQSDVYLNNRAVEIAEPAREIIKRIKKYQS
jgi:DNA-binding MarR family transcriptional regulator